MATGTVDAKQLVLNMLKQETERDKQRKIGPSSLGNPCEYCLGRALVGADRGGHNEYWMGAKIGTAIHKYLEDEAIGNYHNPQHYRLKALKGSIPEPKIYVGDIEGYGKIHGSADLVLPEYRLVIDYKTTTRAKLMKIRLDGLPVQYIGQQQLYMLGLNEQMGIPIDRAELVFICRDGTGDTDIWSAGVDYDPGVGRALLARAEKLYAFLKTLEGPELFEQLEFLTSDQQCWPCKNKYYRT